MWDVGVTSGSLCTEILQCALEIIPGPRTTVPNAWNLVLGTTWQLRRRGTELYFLGQCTASDANVHC